MKKILALTVSLLVVHSIQSQTLVGKWDISSLLDHSAQEFLLSPKENHTEVYGSGLVLILDNDGKFHSYRIPGCGQDNFPTSAYGKYTVIDENYIQFFLEKIYEEHETLINRDLGKYYYVRKDNGFRFLKSSGNLEQDKQVLYYRDLLSSKDKEIQQYKNILDWKATNIKDKNEAVSLCLKEAQIENFKILYSQYAESWIIFLVETNKGLRYVFISEEYKAVALLDDSEIKRIDDVVSQTDKDEKLKTKVLKEIYIPQKSTSENNIITVYRKKKTLYKAVYDQYFVQGGGWFTTIYFENGIPVYVQFEEKTAYDQHEYSSKAGFYLLDLKKNKIVTKKIGSRQGAEYFPEQYFQRAMDEIKKQLK